MWKLRSSKRTLVHVKSNGKGEAELVLGQRGRLVQKAFRAANSGHKKLRFGTRKK